MIIAVAGPGPGRTTTALGLASAATAQGRRAVVVDCDPAQGASEATANVNTLAALLDDDRLLRVLPLEHHEVVRWVSGERPADQFSFIDLASDSPIDVLRHADAVVLPLSAAHRIRLHRFLDLRFRMTITEQSTPVFGLHSNVQPHVAREADAQGDAELEDLGVRQLRSVVPTSTALRRLHGNPWHDIWSVLAEVHTPAWMELSNLLNIRAVPGARTVGPG